MIRFGSSAFLGGLQEMHSGVAIGLWSDLVALLELL